MLPKTVLGRQMLRRLKIYDEEAHPHGAQIRDLARAELVPPTTVSERPRLASIQAGDQPVDVLAEEPTQRAAEASEQPVDALTEEPTQDDEQSQQESTRESTEDKVAN
jgi:hypothetical protein